MKIPLRRIFGIALLAATVTACGETLMEPDIVVYSRLGEARFDTVADGLGLRIEYPSPVQRGEGVPLQLIATNTTDTVVTVLWRGERVSYDFVVTRPDSIVVWEKRYGLNLSDVGKIDTLAAGESLVMSYTWDQRDNNGRRVPSGTYLIRGVFFGEPWDNPPRWSGVLYLWTPVRELVIE